MARIDSVRLQTSRMVLLSGISLIAIAAVLALAYELIAQSNSSQYLLDNVVIDPQENQIGEVTLQGENKVSILLGVKQDGTPVKVTVSNEDGKIVGEFLSDKRSDVSVFENSFPRGEFSVITTNLGDNPVNVFVGVKDVKEPGTFIETTDAWWYLIPSAGILGGLGVIVLLTGTIMFVRIKKKHNNEKPTGMEKD